MAHFSNNNYSFYSASTVPDEVDSYSFLRCQDLATTEEFVRWTTPTIDSSTTLLATGYGE